jgi:hypothetical protein
MELAVGFPRCPLDLLGFKWFLIGTPMKVSRSTVVSSVYPVVVMYKRISLYKKGKSNFSKMFF